MFITESEHLILACFFELTGSIFAASMPVPGFIYKVKSSYDCADLHRADQKYDLTVIANFESGHRTLMAALELCSAANRGWFILPALVMLRSAQSQYGAAPGQEAGVYKSMRPADAHLLIGNLMDEAAAEDQFLIKCANKRNWNVELLAQYPTTCAHSLLALALDCSSVFSSTPAHVPRLMATVLARLLRVRCSSKTPLFSPSPTSLRTRQWRQLVPVNHRPMSLQTCVGSSPR